MTVQMIYDLLKNNMCFQDEALKKLIWVLYKDFCLDSNFKQNIMLLGERGSGKTTMLRETATLMDIPMAEIYNMFMPGGFNVNLFLNGFSQMMEQSEDGRGILLLHDFQDSFIYGSSSSFISMLAAGQLFLGDYGYYDISNIIFVGEIDSNQMEHVFVEKRDYYEDFLNYEFLSPTLNAIKDYLRDDNQIVVTEDGHKQVSLQLEQYISEQIKKRFLSASCSKVFPYKIFTQGMRTEDIIKALYSPVSILNLYRDDLTEEYINSANFINKVAYYIMESDDGLHSAAHAIEDVALNDCKHGEKVLKKGSLLF